MQSTLFTPKIHIITKILVLHATLSPTFASLGTIREVFGLLFAIVVV